MGVTTAILGASGYSGQETLDRVLSHPELELVALGSDSLAGQPASALDPRLNGNVPSFVSNADAVEAGAELVFWCLDHERAAALEPPADTVVVDLSGAHRLTEPRSTQRGTASSIRMPRRSATGTTPSRSSSRRTAR